MFYSSDRRDDHLWLDDEETAHIRVLRLKPGDEIHVTDGLGNLYTTQISESAKKTATARIISTESKIYDFECLSVFIAPTKNMERMEWMVEKLTEIGVGQIGFMVCKNSERKEIKTDRLKKKAISAMKQSLKFRLPEILPIEKFETIARECQNQKSYIAHCNNDLSKTHLPDKMTNTGKINLLIGPEGDFARDEVSLALECGMTAVTFGESRLRTETAAIVACTLINKAFVKER